MRKGRDDIAEDLASELWMPPLPDGVEHIWTLWQRIRRRKGQGPNGPLPIEPGDLVAFLSLSRMAIGPDELGLFEIIDDAYLEAFHSGPSPAERSQSVKDSAKRLSRLEDRAQSSPN